MEIDANNRLRSNRFMLLRSSKLEREQALYALKIQLVIQATNNTKE